MDAELQKNQFTKLYSKSYCLSRNMIQFTPCLAFHLNKQSRRVAGFSQQWDRGADTSLILQQGQLRWAHSPQLP